MKHKNSLIADLDASKDHLIDLRWLIDENDLHSGAALTLRGLTNQMIELINEVRRQLMTGQTKAYKERAKNPLAPEIRDAYIAELKARFANS